MSTVTPKTVSFTLVVGEPNKSQVAKSGAWGSFLPQSELSSALQSTSASSEGSGLRVERRG
eukprot:609838-Rhodomonas_salina.1